MNHTAITTSQNANPAKTMSRQKRAFVFVVVAWIVGTILFESISVHGEIVKAKPSIVKPAGKLTSGWLVQQTMSNYETTKAVAMTELRGLVSVGENAKIMARLDAAIAQESAALVKIHRPKARIKRVDPSAGNSPRLANDITPDGLNVDPIVGVMPVATWITRMAYRQLNRSAKPIGIHDLTRHRIALDQARQSAIPGLMRLAVDQRASQMLVLAEAKSALYRNTKTLPASTRKSRKNQRRTSGATSKSKTSISPGNETQASNISPEGFNPKVDTAKYVMPGDTIANGSTKNVLPVSGAQFTMQNAVQGDEAYTAVADLVPTFAESVSPSITGPSMSPPVTSPVVTSPVVESSVVGSPERAVIPDLVDTVAERSPVVTNPARAAGQRHRMHQRQEKLESPIVGNSAKQFRTAEPVERQLDERQSVSRKPDARIAAQWPLNNVTSSNEPNVTLNVENTDVRTVLEMLARGYGMNILVSPDVTGVVTANVEGLTPDQTLHGVMKMCNLRAQTEQGAIYIYPAAKMPQDARVVRHFALDFARAETIEPALQGLLSPIGNAYINKLDAEDNLKTREAIVVIDTLDVIARVEDYIMQVDRAPRQVMIEARVLEVELTDDMQHGVNFDSVLRGDLTVGSFGLADGLASASNPLFFAQIDGSRIQALIDLLETTTDAKTLATPKVMVVNGQNARIQVGQQLGFTVATVTQTSTIQDVQFLETGVVLSVTPTISRDGKVMMEVKPEVSNGQINPNTLLPEEETRELETSVLLNNHQGVVIGGLIQENDRTVIRKLPWLGDVKHVGKLFQRREEVRSRSEIIIALIPHIIEVDDHHQRDHFDEERWNMDYQRTQGPLLYGPLKRSCRPWEPRLPDVYRESSHLDVNRINQMIP